MAHLALGLAHFLDRPELRTLLLSALGGGSLLLVADAGFGRTTALRDALHHTRRQAAWVRCGDAGGDAGRLLDLIIGAIRESLPGAVDVLAERMMTPLDPVDPERAAAALARALERLLVDPLVVCLDDAETLEGPLRHWRSPVASSAATAARCGWRSRPGGRSPSGSPANVPRDGSPISARPTSRTGKVTARLRCPRGVKRLGCKGRLQLRIARRTRSSRSRKVRYRIKAGKRKTVTLKLTAKDVRTLRRRGRRTRGVLTSVEKGRKGRKTTVRNPRLRLVR